MTNSRKDVAICNASGKNICKANCTKSRAASLIDKLDIGVPRGVKFTRSFAKLVELSHTPEWHNRVWRGGGHYEARGDFRAITDGELPVILHHMNKHDRHAGDKLELVETGKLTMLEMNLIQEDIFKIDAAGNRVMRLDVASDVKKVPVQWFRDNVTLKHKQTMREWSMQTVRGRKAETLTGGQKPNQIRIYDKTGHRMALTMSELRKMGKEDRLTAMAGDPKGYAIHFETMWGYKPDQTVTRVERQMGGKTPEMMGLHLVKQLVNLDSIDPFQQLILPTDINRQWPSKWERKPEFRIALEHLQGRVLADGLDNTRNYLRMRCVSDWQFRKLWRRYAEFLAPPEREEVTRRVLLETFRASIHKQFQLAA